MSDEQHTHLLGLVVSIVATCLALSPSHPKVKHLIPCIISGSATAHFVIKVIGDLLEILPQ